MILRGGGKSQGKHGCKTAWKELHWNYSSKNFEIQDPANHTTQKPRICLAVCAQKRNKPPSFLKASFPSLKSFVECAKEQKQILRSPPPNWKAFGAPFTQNDSLSLDDSPSFVMNFWDRTPGRNTPKRKAAPALPGAASV
jgi:hypothetical protein